MGAEWLSAESRRLKNLQKGPLCFKRREGRLCQKPGKEKSGAAAPGTTCAPPEAMSEEEAFAGPRENLFISLAAAWALAWGVFLAPRSPRRCSRHSAAAFAL